MTQEQVFYEFGGMKFTQNTKSHICDNDGKVLCGYKSNWSEAGNQIDNDGFVFGMAHLFSIFDERHNTCKKCLKKYNDYKLNNINQ